MIVVCAWCKRALGTKEPLEDERITDGICPECQVKLIREAENLKIRRKNENERH